MKLAAYITALSILAAPAVAQQAPAISDPKLEATEQMLMAEMTAHRNWNATAIDLNAKWQQTVKQLAEATTQIAALQKQIDAAKESAAAAKAIVPPPANAP